MTVPGMLRPEWDPPPGVGAFLSTRAGGVSGAPFDSLNLGAAVGDDPAAVAENRRRLFLATGAQPVWLRQVHGARVLHVGAADAAPDTVALEADAAWTDEPGIACTVQVADCLPVLLARVDGRRVAAVHAGWRGLAAGVVEHALEALGPGADVVAWLGPCIGPRQFEVGDDVLWAFGADPGAPDPARFVHRARADGAPRWLANLPGLAEDRLRRAGVRRIGVDGRCTVEVGSRFFSFRRDGRTGRFAAGIWICG
jgi:YfiH family protein